MSFSLTPVKIVPWIFTVKNDCQVQMSEQLFTHLQLKENLDLKITLGKKTITTTVQTVEMAADEILLPEKMITEFCLPLQSYKFQAMYLAESHTLKLGPMVGLLTNFTSNKHEEPHFRTIHSFCEELHHGITMQGGFFYVFSYDKFLNEGYYLDDGKWILFEPPLPDVIYNRIHSRRLEQKDSYKHFRKRLEQLMIPIFNDRFLSKWEVYEQLSEERHLFPYIPETKIFSKEHLHDFIQKYETVFLKPIHGSQGRNIIKVIKEMEYLYTFQTSLTDQSDQLGNKYSLDEIYPLIKPILHNRIYIIQQGLSLVTHQSCAIDFRVLCHKNQTDHWEITSIVARIAAEQEFVSNIAKGGTITRPLNVLRTCLDRRKSLEVLAQMKELALETASVISSHSAGITGELGIDIGVDLDGRLWLIEVNSKPSKNFDDGLGKIRPSAKAIIQFCAKLGFETEPLKE
ncbi:Endospore coat-associated protein YheD [Neobacillus rhizosphaerae]|uniref:Endospore coat-associated protein YheD n=1 Tax=Neobacillus rhizosphaerae TaxID=2880965 RepID=A0ABN8KKV7_9BACI|nr:YheC/YheD family protein [Neobacillus rhizosphaerae]CAH2713575.1 Endospore coat-associated protein YheD [Neobacillus rhizosphaerae]